jgi:hypothetical protein
MRNRVSTIMEEALGQLGKRIAPGRLKDRSKIERVLGTIQARHPSVNDLRKWLFGKSRIDYVFDAI